VLAAAGEPETLCRFELNDPTMPELSRFLGIVIGMFYREHGVAHIHAVYGEYEMSVEVETGTVHGHFPPRAQSSCLKGWLFTRKNCLKIGNWPSKANL
jgi:uncharacterized protein DUF4160